MASVDVHGTSRILRETWAVTVAEIRDMVLSVRLVFLVVVYLGCAGIIGRIAVWFDEKTGGKLASGTTALTGEERELVFNSFVEQGASEHLARAVVDGDLPPMVLIVLIGSTFVIPALMLLVGFNRISEDVTRRFTRYLLQRIHRGSYLAGKLLAHWLVSTVAILAVQAVLLAYASFHELFEMDTTLAAIPRIWTAMAILILAYSAFTMFVSSSLNPPILVLLVGLLGLMGVRLLTFVLGLLNPLLGQIWMGQWDIALYALDPQAIAIFFAYILAFIAGAHFVLRGRDL